MSLAPRSIDPKPFVELAGALPSLEPGPAPQLRWIEIDKLVVDPTYQRDIGGSGKKNIARIARDFEWSHFATVVVAPAGERFVIVDGQHRTTAAALRGFKKVPCQIIVADKRKQAAAFAAINANVTEMSPMQLHAAKLAAADPEAVRLDRICRDTGVTVLRYPIYTKNQKAGDTMAPGALYRALGRYGEVVLHAALSCLTRTRDGYPGFLRSGMITALCTVIQSETAWQDEKRLLPAIEKLDLRATFEQAWQSAKAGSSGGAVKALIELITGHLHSQQARQVTRPAPVAESAPKIATGSVLVTAAGRVYFNNRSAVVSKLDAILIALLARGMPHPIGLDFLKKRVWPSGPWSDAHDRLDFMARTLAKPLAAIGLDIKHVKGAGIVLRAVE